MIDLGTITNLQKMVGIAITPKDANEHAVANFNQPNITVDQTAALSVANVIQAADGKSATFDVIGHAPSSGPVTINIQGQQGNFQPHYSTQAQITVILDPSLPGPPTHFDVAPGSVVPQ